MLTFIIFKLITIYIVKTRSNITYIFFILSQNHLSRTMILSVNILITEKLLVKILNLVGTYINIFKNKLRYIKNKSLCCHMEFVK